MSKCNQSNAEKLWLKSLNLQGYDKISDNQSFGLIKDKEGSIFRNIPDAVLLNKRTLDLYIVDHKTCPLNGTLCKRTADSNKEKQTIRGNKGLSFIASWSNSFHQKDLIQRAFRDIAIANVYYIVVTKSRIDMKKSWQKKNRFVMNLTEKEFFELNADVIEIGTFDSRLSSHQMDGVGGLLTSLPSIENERSEFKAITPRGIKTFEASELVRVETKVIEAKLMI